MLTSRQGVPEGGRRVCIGDLVWSDKGNGVWGMGAPSVRKIVHTHSI